ncbi:MAG: hypothetical protein M4579_007284 [Chaenotheca gracillima]|nr:MAG: hypothetical protein M4579_007284 [Chaenotheca gracillima]
MGPPSRPVDMLIDKLLTQTPRTAVHIAIRTRRTGVMEIGSRPDDEDQHHLTYSIFAVAEFVPASAGDSPKPNFLLLPLASNARPRHCAGDFAPRSEKEKSGAVPVRIHSAPSKRDAKVSEPGGQRSKA